MRIPARIQRQKGRWALVDGIPFELPVVCGRSPALMAAFTIDASKAAALMPGREIFPLRLWNNRGVLMIVVINYLQTTIGKYVEFSVGIACTHGKRAAPPLLPAALMGLYGTGQYVFDLPVSSEVSVKGGKGIWGGGHARRSFRSVVPGLRRGAEYSTGRNGKRRQPDAERRMARSTQVAFSRIGDGDPKRSLVLSGGGMRVSYQAGVLKALMEEGLTFFHADGTSGGGMSLAMLFSGLSPDEMCDRWRTLRIGDFISFMPLSNYINATGAMALGGTTGIVEKVFPHLGIDIDRVNRATGIAGTFNVCNYTRKVNEVIPHEQIDIEMLVAGMSLPIFMPPVKRGEYWYTDSAFIRDANPLEAVRRGADEIWIVWTLGNSPDYRPGIFAQYIQILEMSANGALFEDFERIADINQRIGAGETVFGRTQPIKVHVISPERPLPLDPDLYFGQTDNATLIDMGYRDARRYLGRRRDEGTLLTPEATAMQQPELGVTFRETMSGPFALGQTDPQAGEKAGKQADTSLSMHASVEIGNLDRFVADPTHAGRISGHIDFKPFGNQIPADRGVFRLFSPTGQQGLSRMVYELGFQHQGKPYYLAGYKEVRNDRHGTDLWNDTTTLYTRLHDGTDGTGTVVGAGVLRLGVPDLMKLTSTMRVVNASSPADHVRALSTFGRFFMGNLWDTYAPKREAQP